MLNVITDNSKGQKFCTLLRCFEILREGRCFKITPRDPFWVFEPPWPTSKPWNSAKKNMRYFNKISLVELFCNHHWNHALYPETKRPDHRDQRLCTSPKQLRKELIDGKRNRRGLLAKVSWWHICLTPPKSCPSLVDEFDTSGKK